MCTAFQLDMHCLSLYAKVALYLELLYSSSDTVILFTALYSILICLPAVIYLFIVDLMKVISAVKFSWASHMVMTL
jgi:hypothetical protein